MDNRQTEIKRSQILAYLDNYEEAYTNLMSTAGVVKDLILAVGDKLDIRAYTSLNTPLPILNLYRFSLGFNKPGVRDLKWIARTVNVILRHDKILKPRKEVKLITEMVKQLDDHILSEAILTRSFVVVNEAYSTVNLMNVLTKELVLQCRILISLAGKDELPVFADHHKMTLGKNPVHELNRVKALEEMKDSAIMPIMDSSSSKIFTGRLYEMANYKSKDAVVELNKSLVKLSLSYFKHPSPAIEIKIAPIAKELTVALRDK